MIGDASGVEVGQQYGTRRLAHEAGVHRPLHAGICGSLVPFPTGLAVNPGSFSPRVEYVSKFPRTPPFGAS